MNSAVHTLLTAISRWLLLVILIVTTPTLLNAQSALTDDTQTNATTRNADKNFGSSPTLTVSSSANSYLKFKLSSTVASGTTRADIAKATIKLYIGNIATPGKIDVYQVAGPWEEAALTFNNSPVVGTLLATTPLIDLDKKNEYVVIDVTQAVKDWLGDDGQGTNGAPNYGLLLVPHPIDADTPALANITFDSKENVQTSHEPELNIALTKTTGLANVSHDGTLSGDGTSASPLRIPNQAVNTAQLADSSVTGMKLENLSVTNDKLADGSISSQKIAAGQVLKSVNGLTDNVTLQAGANITIVPSGNTLTIDGVGGGLPTVSHNATLAGNGTADSPLSVGVPLTLIGPVSPSSPTFTVTSQGGTAISAQGIIDGTRYYSLNGERMLSNPGVGNTFVGVWTGQNNTEGRLNSFFGFFAGRNNISGWGNSFFGMGAGNSNTTGNLNSFMGHDSGYSNTSGQSNSFFGTGAGRGNTSGSGNSFFGASSGYQTTTGTLNSFFGHGAGTANVDGFNNSFFGSNAGLATTSGGGNSFFGHQTGLANTTGRDNAFFGVSAGQSNTSENNNTFIGAFSNGVPGITNATAVGSGAVVQRSNAVVLGNNADVGIGTSGPKARLHVAGGRVYVEANGQGLILKSPNGSVCIEITASNTGTLQSALIACP